jgi:hypothetical protein
MHAVGSLGVFGEIIMGVAKTCVVLFCGGLWITKHVRMTTYSCPKGVIIAAV